MDLADRVAVVTGASTGIGRATARALAEEGASVALAARNEEKLQQLADEIQTAGGEALAVPTDVRERDRLEALFETAATRLGGFDILVNNAGVGHWDHFGTVDGDLDEWRTDIEVNLIGLMEATQLAAERLTAQGSGHIVNVSSGSGRSPHPDIPSYVASKFGVNGFTRSVWRDLRGTGVRVTLLMPGQVDTPMQYTATEAERRKMLRPADIADTVVYAVTRPEGVLVAEMFVVPTGTATAENEE